MDGSCNVFLQIAHESNEVDHDHTATAFHFLTSIFLFVDGVVVVAAVVVVVVVGAASMASSETIVISSSSARFFSSLFEASCVSVSRTTFQNLGFQDKP